MENLFENSWKLIFFERGEVGAIRSDISEIDKHSSKPQGSGMPSILRYFTRITNSRKFDEGISYTWKLNDRQNIFMKTIVRKIHEGRKHEAFIITMQGH